MTPADVISEMREWADRDYPQIGAWADALEAAMQEPVGIVEDVIIEAGGAFGDHEIRKSRRARWLRNKPPIGTKIFTFPPDNDGMSRIRELTR